LKYCSPPPVVAIAPWLLRRRLPAGVKLVYALIAACADRVTGEAQVGQQELAHMLAMTDRHVRDAITRLRELRLLDWKRAGTGTKVNTYTVNDRHPWKGPAPRTVLGSRENAR
jgi:hypothetical protein